MLCYHEGSNQQEKILTRKLINKFFRHVYKNVRDHFHTDYLLACNFNASNNIAVAYQWIFIKSIH